MIALDHFRAFAALLLQLERRLEEVDVEPCSSVEPGHHSRRVRTVKAAVAHWSTHNRAVLLLDECLVVLLIGTRARHLEFLFAAPRDDHVIHEGAVVVEVHAAQKPGEQALNVLHRLSLASRVESVRAIHKRAYAQAGRLEEARAAAAEVLRINPTFTIDSWKP